MVENTEIKQESTKNDGFKNALQKSIEKSIEAIEPDLLKPENSSKLENNKSTDASKLDAKFQNTPPSTPNGIVTKEQKTELEAASIFGKPYFHKIYTEYEPNQITEHLKKDAIREEQKRLRIKPSLLLNSPAISRGSEKFVTQPSKTEVDCLNFDVKKLDSLDLAEILKESKRNEALDRRTDNLVKGHFSEIGQPYKTVGLLYTNTSDLINSGLTEDVVHKMPKNKAGVVMSTGKGGRIGKAMKRVGTVRVGRSMAKSVVSGEKLAKSLESKMESKKHNEKNQKVVNMAQIINQNKIEKGGISEVGQKSEQNSGQNKNQSSNQNNEEESDSVVSLKSTKNNNLKKRFRNRNFDTVFGGREEEALKRMFAAEERLNTQLGLNKDKK